MTNDKTLSQLCHLHTPSPYNNIVFQQKRYTNATLQEMFETLLTQNKIIESIIQIIDFCRWLTD